MTYGRYPPEEALGAQKRTHSRFPTLVSIAWHKEWEHKICLFASNVLVSGGVDFSVVAPFVIRDAAKAELDNINAPPSSLFMEFPWIAEIS